MTNEEPSFSTYRRRTNIIFNEVIVDLEAPILEIDLHSRVLIEKVVDGFAHGTLGQQFGLQFLRVLLQPSPDRRGFKQADLVTICRRERADPVLDTVELPNPEDKPQCFGKRFLQCLIKATATVR